MKEKLSELKELLIVVDMVNGFIREGALADPSVAKIIPEIECLVRKFLESGKGVLFVKDCHTLDSTEFKSFPPHCLKGSNEAKLVDELLPYEELSMSIEKNSTSAIFADGFLTLIDEMKELKTVVGVGCESDICVPNLFIPLKNYFNQKNRDIDVVVVEDAIETFDSPSHSREEYSKASKLLMSQAGIRLVKKYEK